MNLGVEGMMLMGAVTGFAVTVYTQNLWLGIITAMAAGGLLALIHAFLTVSLKANQVVSGLALTIFGTGLSAYLGKPLIGIPAPVTFKAVDIPGLSAIPLLGPVLFKHDMLIYLSFAMVLLCWFVLYKTKTGLVLRAVGENPAAADAAGINIFGSESGGDFGRNAVGRGWSLSLISLCAILAGKYDRRAGLDCGGPGYLCDVEPGEGNHWRLFLRRHRRFRLLYADAGCAYSLVLSEDVALPLYLYHINRNYARD